MPEGEIDYIPATRALSTREQVLRVVWLVSAVALGAQAQNGADFGRYSQWPKAFASSDILRIGSAVLSPVGVPMTHWSHAPGLITDALHRTLGLLPAVDIGLHTVSWLTAIAFWWAMMGLVRLATRRDPALFVLAIGAAFIGTHAGFYSIFHSSEIFSLSTFAVAVFWALSAGPERLRDSFIVGIACGLLLIVRVNLAMYVLLPIAARALIVWRGNGNRLSLALVIHAVALGIPLLAYGVQLLLFNYWATGLPTRSPYIYGDGSFKSADFAHPMGLTMLFHSWHGLLTYHPLFALGPIALVALAVRRALPLAERLFAGYALFALLAQFYVQASWWCWWNGTGTFGNRTLAVGSVVVVVALVRWLFLLLQSESRRVLSFACGLLLVTAACCFWSFLLYVQGHSNYVTWRQLLSEQRKLLVDSSIFLPAGLAAVMSLAFAIAAFRSLRARAVFAAVAAFIAALAAQGLFADLVRNWLVRHQLAGFTPVTLAGVSAIAFTLSIYLATARYAVQNPTRWARTAVASALLCVFVVGSWSFTELAIAAKVVIARSTAQTRNYRYRAAMSVDDLLGCVSEYDRVPGFAAQKEAFRRFIEAAASEARRKLVAPAAGAAKPLPS